MLELRPGCECCDRDLPPSSTKARSCSFEFTFCSGCADGVLSGLCSNCRGALLARPVRPAHLLPHFPASTLRVPKASGCSPSAP